VGYGLSLFKSKLRVAICVLVLSPIVFLFTNAAAPPSGTTNSNQVYFGYFYDSLGSSTDFTPQTSSLSNVHWIYSDAGTLAYSPDGTVKPGPNAWPQVGINPSSAQITAAYRSFKIDCSGWTSKFSKAKSSNHKVIVDIQRDLFIKSNAPIGYSPILTPDYVQRFQSLLPCLTPFSNQIVGFYIFDEPYFNNGNITPHLSPWSPSTDANTSVYMNLSLASSLIKGSFQKTKTMTSLAYPDLQAGNLNVSTDLSKIIPENIDWYGLDCYLKEGENCSESFIQGAMTKLDQMRKFGQSLIVFLDATYSSTLPASQANIELQARNQFWLQITKNMPVAGYFPFIYQGGVKDMPDMEAYLKRVYSCTQTIGCMVDSLTTSPSKPLSPSQSVLSAGFIRAGNSGYHSLGNGQVCGYTSMEHLISCGENPNDYTSGVDIGKLPNSVSDVTSCQCGTRVRPYGGLFKDENGSAYMRVSSAAVCTFNSMEHLTSCGFNSASYSSARKPPLKITNLRNAPLCNCGNQVYQAGIFKFKSSGYTSDGTGSYCSYSSITHLESCGESLQRYSSLPDVYSIPSSMTYTGACKCK
jgi:hypothetical protein